MLIALLATLGCHRGHYREQADVQAYNLIRSNSYAHWPLEDIRIYVDPRSRMFDPFCPEREPMPPDDPAAHELMHFVDGKKGYAHWHANGDTTSVENPNWMEYLPLDENGVLNLSANQAYDLALLNSRSYQREFETLYLSALDVSTEKFRFDTQFFGGHSSFFTTSGRLRTPRSELDLSTFSQQTGRLGLPVGGVTAPSQANVLLRKSFATGADLAVGFANSLIWEFGGPNDYTGFTILDLSLVQPLLRAAGKDRIMEQLTLAERALLANVRQMERFRRGFYVEILTGVNAPDGATRRGGFFGASGLEGFSGVGGGGFGRIGGGFGGGGAGDGFGGGGAGAAQVGGFMGLLQALQDIRNQQATIVGLRNNLAQLRESLNENLLRIPEDVETLVRERLQIAQARQALLNSESVLINSQANYQTTLDGFKITLGLPPHICVNVDDPMVDAFNLLDPGILVVQERLTKLRSVVALVNEQILTTAASAPVDADQKRVLILDEKLARQLTRLRNHIHRIHGIVEQINQGNLAAARRDVERLRQALPERRRSLIAMRDRYQQDNDRFEQYNNLDPCQETLLADIDPAVFDFQRLEMAPGQLAAEVSDLATKFGSYALPLADMDAYLNDLLTTAGRSEEVDYQALEQRVIFAIPSLLSDLTQDVLDLQLVQARGRTDTVDLIAIDLKWDLALEIARKYRRDWMNQRAGLVDSWRLIEFNADNLESNLDIVFDGDLQNVGDNPLSFQAINGQARAGLRFDAPITRLQERNTYRQALIEYQQARRTYYLFEDNISRVLRFTLRTIDLNRVNFEERRIAVLSAIDQVVLTDQIQKLREERGLEAGVTAARDVVSALADLQSAQNDFLSVWLSYEAQRLSLDLNLGTMNLDPTGLWIDPGPIGDEFGYPAPFGYSGEAELTLEPGLILEDPAPDPLLPPPAPPAGDSAGRTSGVIHSSFLEAAFAPSIGSMPLSGQRAIRRLPAVGGAPRRDP